VPCFQDFCRTFTNYNTGRHGVAGSHARHDAAIRNAKVFDSVSTLAISKMDCCSTCVNEPFSTGPAMAETLDTSVSNSSVVLVW
jgi:hypothetical protein